MTGESLFEQLAGLAFVPLVVFELHGSSGRAVDLREVPDLGPTEL